MRNVLRFLAGALAGALLWWYGAPAYDGVVAAVAKPLLRLQFHDLNTETRDRWVIVRSASGQFRTAEIPADQMTYNAILFIALLATVRRPRWGGVVLAVIALFASHVITFCVGTESLYANARDPASTAANVWMMGNLFLRVVGMLAVAFGCWWLVRAGAVPAPARPSRRRRD